MKDRIREIRKDNKLTQAEFGGRIGVRANTITNYESGLRTPADAIILSICKEFGINEEWLKTGTGKKYKQKNDLFSEILSDLEDSDDEFIKELIMVYMELDEDSKKALKKIAIGMSKRYGKQI